MNVANHVEWLHVGYLSEKRAASLNDAAHLKR
jgi:hypothetical protein